MKLNLERLPEANIQAEIYRRLTNDGITCFLEIGFMSELGRVEADITVVKDDEVICLCEVKRWTKKRYPVKTKQYKKYESLNIPFLYCANWDDIPSTILRIKEYLWGGEGYVYSFDEYI